MLSSLKSLVSWQQSTCEEAIAPLVTRGLRRIRELGAQHAAEGHRFREVFVMMQTQGPRWIPAICEYIDGHVHEPMKVSQLAAVAKVHPVYFSRTFKASCGMSVLRYVRQRRVVAAASAMGKKPVRLADVANQFGFADQAHFSRAFRQEFGASPSKYRSGATSTAA